MEDAERYKEALEFLQGRFEWGVAEAVLIIMQSYWLFVWRNDLDEALDFEDDGDDEELVCFMNQRGNTQFIVYIQSMEIYL